MVLEKLIYGKIKQLTSYIKINLKFIDRLKDNIG